MFANIRIKEAIILAVILTISIFLIGCSEPSTEIRPGNEPFLYDLESDIGVLLIHGFTASPWEVKELGGFLAAKNITSYGILLAGHGTDVRILKETTWKEWYDDAEKAFLKLKATNKNVYVGGISFGASLAFALAEKYDVAGVISISSPIYLRDEQTAYVNYLKYVREYVPSNLTEEERYYYYDKKPLKAIAQLMDLISYYKKDLQKVTEPVLILQSEQDKTIQPYSAAIIYEKIGSEDKEIKWFKGKSHVLLKSEYKDELFDIIYEFIDRTS